MSRLNIIPEPQAVECLSGCFNLNRKTLIAYKSSDVKKASVFLHDLIHKHFGLRLKKPVAADDRSAGIILQADSAIQEDGYRLTVNSDGINISAGGYAELIHGIFTLIQVIPLDTGKDSVTFDVPCVRIDDKPRFKWRGLMLDVGRYFFSVSDVKKFIDSMAYYKFNMLHLHLTEDQGWRLEIRKYPKLTAMSAWRKETVVGHMEAKGNVFDGRPHGGFYTQEDIRDIVRYAEERAITVVPEIEMPGHAQAALAAFPNLSCTGGPFDVSSKWGVHREVYCAGNDKVIKFLENVIDEVLEMFPGKYIHIGGDECPKERWKECPKCQARIKKEGLKDEHELQSWFIRHFDRYLQERGRRLIGWDEILEGGLAKGAIVMSWHGEDGGINAAKQGNDAVMAPKDSTYFDYYQAEDRSREPLAIGGFLPLDKTYDYEPVPGKLSAAESRHILGAQAQLWTEYMPNLKQVEYMVFPRALALSEVLWSPKEKRDYADFRIRLTGQLQRLDRLGFNYRPLDK